MTSVLFPIIRTHFIDWALSVATERIRDNFAIPPPKMSLWSDLFSLPLIRRRFPALMASKMVSVQPISAPSGLTFAMRYKWQS